jgi:hypothetical protein
LEEEVAALIQQGIQLQVVQEEVLAVRVNLELQELLVKVIKAETSEQQVMSGVLGAAAVLELLVETLVIQQAAVMVVMVYNLLLMEL